MKKTIATMLAVVLGVVSLTACGSSNTAATTETAQTVESAAADTETTAAETETAADTETASTDAAVTTLQDGVLTVGSNLTFPPFDTVDDNGTPDGFDVKLIEAIAEKLGLTVEW